MHDDGNNVNTLDEDYYSNDAAADDDDDDDDDDDVYELANYSDQPKIFTVLKEEDIRQRQRDDVTKISAVLSVSRGSAFILLLRYNWNINKVYEEWFVDEDRVRNAVGLLEKPVVVESRNTRKDIMIACGICFDSYRRDSIVTAACGHLFCCNCWTAYISTAINNGPGCLTLKCPAPSCGVVVGIDMVNMLASDENKDKYHRYLLRSYVEDNKTIKWCPAPGCESAVEYDVGSGGSYDVSCVCSYSFCWNCTEDAHRPVDCDTVAKWVLKNNDESENTSWILANSKPCPKCKRAIEKNQGCNHMTCREPCKFQFCWICGAEWSGHRACNRYDGAVDREREKAKKYILRYTHHYERWASNESSRKKALADLHQMQTVHLKKLSEKLHQPEIKLEFITEGWLQIVECRRVLKWTYAYGYYLPEKEHAKRQFFEYLQGEAEAGLERLHHCAEKELLNYLGDSSLDNDDFRIFRTKLAGLTSVTRNYFENLVRALENGLSEVESQVVSSNNTSSKKAAAGTSKRRVDAETEFYKELWRACAGPLVTVPREGELVYYFPQGHI